MVKPHPRGCDIRLRGQGKNNNHNKFFSRIRADGIFYFILFILFCIRTDRPTSAALCGCDTHLRRREKKNFYYFYFILFYFYFSAFVRMGVPSARIGEMTPSIVH
jgi:hypothetical protein